MVGVGMMWAESALDKIFRVHQLIECVCVSWETMNI